jgi:tetratricopeptide (TPR) repeat protein
MAAEDQDTSDGVRRKGNEKYKAGEFEAAIALYTKAAQLAPEEAAPWSNLSAAYYELYDYQAYDNACTEALNRLSDKAQDIPAKQQKLYLRQSRARLTTLHVDEAKAAVGRLPHGQEKLDLVRSLVTCQAIGIEAKDRESYHRRLILELPRYKPKMYVFV